MLMKSPDRAATLFYQANGFRVMTPGSHVVCAVTGQQIPLDMLRYWSAARQEPYADAAAATRQMCGRP